MLYALINFIPLIYSIIMELSDIMDLFALPIISSMFRNRTAIVIMATIRGTSETRARGIFTVNR